MSETFEGTILSFLGTRQSAAAFTLPAPSEAEIAGFVVAATSAPDHGRLRPYRFVLLDEGSRERFADGLVEAVDTARGGITDELKSKIRKKTEVAPVQVAVIFSPRDTGRIPAWEQMITASCAGYGLMLAAQAAGWGASWKSNPTMDGALLRELLGLAEAEQFLGWVNLGTAVQPVNGRAEVDLAPLFSRA